MTPCSPFLTMTPLRAVRHDRRGRPPAGCWSRRTAGPPASLIVMMLERRIASVSCAFCGLDPEVHRVEHHQLRALDLLLHRPSGASAGCSPGRRTRPCGSSRAGSGWKSANTPSSRLQRVAAVHVVVVARLPEERLAAGLRCRPSRSTPFFVQQVDVLLREVVADHGDDADVGVQLRRQREVRRRAAQHPLGRSNGVSRVSRPSEPTAIRGCSTDHRSVSAVAQMQARSRGMRGIIRSSRSRTRALFRWKTSMHAGHRDRLDVGAALQAGVVVGDQRDVDVTHLQLAGQHLLRDTGSC